MAARPTNRSNFSRKRSRLGPRRDGYGDGEPNDGWPINEKRRPIICDLSFVCRTPNEVALFFLHYPEFLPGIMDTIRLVIKQELYNFFSSDITSINTVPEKAAELGYSTITQENITAALAKAAPLDKMQMEVHQK